LWISWYEPERWETSPAWAYPIVKTKRLARTSAWKSRKLIGFDNLVFIINPSLRLEFYPAKASVGSRYGLRADWAASIVTDDCDGGHIEAPCPDAAFYIELNLFIFGGRD
jgi:hypothetical protein